MKRSQLRTGSQYLYSPNARNVLYPTFQRVKVVSTQACIEAGRPMNEDGTRIEYETGGRAVHVKLLDATLGFLDAAPSAATGWRGNSKAVLPIHLWGFWNDCRYIINARGLAIRADRPMSEADNDVLNAISSTYYPRVDGDFVGDLRSGGGILYRWSRRQWVPIQVGQLAYANYASTLPENTPQSEAAERAYYEEAYPPRDGEYVNEIFHGRTVEGWIANTFRWGGNMWVIDGLEDRNVTRILRILLDIQVRRNAASGRPIDDSDGRPMFRDESSTHYATWESNTRNRSGVPGRMRRITPIEPASEWLEADVAAHVQFDEVIEQDVAMRYTELRTQGAYRRPSDNRLFTAGIARQISHEVLAQAPMIDEVLASERAHAHRSIIENIVAQVRAEQVVDPNATLDIEPALAAGDISEIVAEAATALRNGENPRDAMEFLSMEIEGLQRDFDNARAMQHEGDVITISGPGIGQNVTGVSNGDGTITLTPTTDGGYVGIATEGELHVDGEPAESIADGLVRARRERLTSDEVDFNEFMASLAPDDYVRIITPLMNEASGLRERWTRLNSRLNYTEPPF